jgi:predicted aldo/keto reductase-like oxidoreductase
MKYINKDEISEDKTKQKEINFNRNGMTITSGTEKVFAKILAAEKDTQYHIKIYQNQPFDPMGSNSTRERYLETKFKRVSKDTFDFYLIYLQTNNSIYLTRTNRRFINE